MPAATVPAATVPVADDVSPDNLSGTTWVFCSVGVAGGSIVFDVTSLFDADVDLWDNLVDTVVVDADKAPLTVSVARVAGVAGLLEAWIVGVVGATVVVVVVRDGVGLVTFCAVVVFLAGVVC